MGFQAKARFKFIVLEIKELIIKLTYYPRTITHGQLVREKTTWATLHHQK